VTSIAEAYPLLQPNRSRLTAALHCMKKRVAASMIVGGLAIAALGTPLGSNLWSLATGRGFFIPAESSVFSFRATKMNEGSGEWWLYGRDDERLFALHPSEPIYVSAHLAFQVHCQAFDAENFETWCSSERRKAPQQ
jgi:hypothetical protein